MKWCTPVKKNNVSYVIYHNEIKEGWHSELGGLRKWRVSDIIPARALKSEHECYIVEWEGTILFYLEMLYNLRCKHRRKNSIFPYWFSKRGTIKT